MNTVKTGILLAALTALFMGVGYLIGGGSGAVIAFFVAAAMNLFAYWNSDRMVLSMYGAEEVDERTAPDYVHIVRDLAARAGLPMPRTYIIQSQQPNAFATGRNPEHAAVAATTGILDMLSREELTGVLAHELSHIRNRDTLTMTITATFAGAISMLANFAFFFGGFFGGNRENNGGIVGTLALAILAPIAAALVQMAISRTREYDADAWGAEISGQPLWLASALRKIDRTVHVVPNAAAEANPATAHMFIVNPLAAHGGGADSLFSTHPSTENRIARLEAMAGETPGRRTPTPAAAPRGPWG